MILLALGANLPTDLYGPPRAGLEAALLRLERAGLRIDRRSRWYRSAPVPASDQPWFINGVVSVETLCPPRSLMEYLLEIEREFGRSRAQTLVPRVLDLDLIDYHGMTVDIAADRDGPALTLPHPRLAERAFVLLPLREIAPDWRHPQTGAHLDALIRELPADQTAVPIDPETM